MKFLFRWLFSGEMMDEYLKGWSAGVNQQKWEPDSAEHGYKTHLEYYGEEE